ncbi:MAG: hypothetical protein SGBAC_005389 [Bacillariaceae sp.]
MISGHAKKHGTVYQIQCEAQNKGKRVASSKRRIRWRFGFANKNAIQQGKTGVDCRGAEHEVVFVWSLNSGKQLILADGVEVHWAKIGRKEKLEVAWDMSNGNHTLKVVAEPSNKSRKSSGESRQFDLLIDGISFAELPSIYQLGTTKDVSSTPKRKSAQPMIRKENRSYSMPDLLSLSTTQTATTPPPKSMAQQHEQSSPTSSIDLAIFDHGIEVQYQYHQQKQQQQQQVLPQMVRPKPPQYQRSQSASFSQTPHQQQHQHQQQQQQQHQYQRSHSITTGTPERAQQATATSATPYNYAWNDATATVPTPQQAYHSRNSWQSQTSTTTTSQQQSASYNYNWSDAASSSPQKRGSIGGNSYASSTGSNNPYFMAAAAAAASPQKPLSNGYSTPTISVSPSPLGYDSDLNDSPLSQALKSLGVSLDASSHHRRASLELNNNNSSHHHHSSISMNDDRSVTSNLSVASNPFDFVTTTTTTMAPPPPTYLPALMMPQQQANARPASFSGPMH